MSSVKIPRSLSKGVKFDTNNGNTLWANAADKEIEPILEYESYHDDGKNAAK